MSGRSARTIRNFSLELWQDLVLLDVRKSTFHSTVVGKLESQCTRNGPQTPPFCPGSLQDTFIICSSISHQHMFQKYVAKRKISRIENLKIWKSENPGSLTSAQFKLNMSTFMQKWLQHGCPKNRNCGFGGNCCGNRFWTCSTHVHAMCHSSCMYQCGHLGTC